MGDASGSNPDRSTLKMKNRKIKAVIFDLGDTLIKQKVSFYKRLKRSYDIKVELDLFRKVFSKLFHTKSWEDTNNVMKKLAKICKLENNPSFLKYLEHLFINQKYFYVKFSGTERLLKELNNNDYKTAMITKKTPKNKLWNVALCQKIKKSISGKIAKVLNNIINFLSIS